MRVKTMQFKKSCTAAHYVIAAITLLALGACNDGKAARDAAPPGGIATPANYVLVTQFRPEQPEKFFEFFRASYDLCAAAANVSHIAVKPFPALPKDLILGRKTYASDGKRVVLRETASSVDFVKDNHKNDCEMRMTSHTNVSVISEGLDHKSFRDEDGKVTVDVPEPYDIPPLDTSALSRFTTARTVNGVNLKCNSLQLCIVDPALAVVRLSGEPAEAYTRVEGAGFGQTAMLTEPVSLVVGKPVDPALFALDKF